MRKKNSIDKSTGGDNKHLRTILFCILSFFILLILLFTVHVIYVRKNGDIFKGITFSKAYTDRNGELLQVYLTPDDKYRIYRPITSYTPEFLDLILLQEDKFFFGHHGVNYASLFKGFYETYIIRQQRIGGSTITMQAAKLKYKLYTRNILGKINQIFLAWYLELCFSKQDILDLYLNLAPCGGNIEGFEAASWFYFNKMIPSLDIPENCLLCVLPQNPNDRAPYVSNGIQVPSVLVSARKQLFTRWVEVHPEDAKNQFVFDMEIPLICKMPDRTRHFTQMLMQNSENQHNLPIRTTIDLYMQNKCENYLSAHLNKNRSVGVFNGALLLFDSQTMEVLASIGSADFFNNDIEGQVNATTAKRSPGSTLKPFIYALALEEGLIHSHTMLKDTPITFNEYSPDNFGSIYKGPVSAWFALDDSRNIPAIALNSTLTKTDLYSYMVKSGISGMKDRDHYGLSIVLGSAEVTMIELGEMYSAIPNGGIQKKLKYSMNTHSTTGKRMLTEESAYIIRRMLEKNIPPYQTRPKEVLSTPIAYKTGTSVGFKDCWTVAIFDNYILCVWIGNFNGLGNNSFLGRTMAAPLAFSIADSIIMDTNGHNSYVYPEQPENVAKIEVCAVSGGLPTENCLHTESAWFIPGVSPITKCKIHRKINIDTRTGYRTDEVNQPYVKSIIREFWPSDLQELFKQAGLPRLVPPDYPKEDFKLNVSSLGYPPEIISPSSNTEYIYRSDDNSKNHLILTAVADADSKELLWFEDDTFIGRCAPGERLLWKPLPGEYILTVADTKGRSSSVNVIIKYDWQVSVIIKEDASD